MSDKQDSAFPKENLADEILPDALRFMWPADDSKAGGSSLRFTSYQRKKKTKTLNKPQTHREWTNTGNWNSKLE